MFTSNDIDFSIYIIYIYLTNPHPQDFDSFLTGTVEDHFCLSHLYPTEMCLVPL